MPTLVKAESVQELEKQKQELESKSNDLNSKIKKQEDTLNNLESQKADLEGDVKQLQTKIDEVVLKLHEQEKKLADSKVKIEKLQKEIEALKELIAQREEKLENQARVVQTDARSSNMVEMIISSESLSDLIGRVGIISQLVTANKDIVMEQQNDQKKLEANEKKAEEEKVAIESLKSEIEVAKNNLVTQKAEMDDKIIQLAAQYDMTESEKNSFVNEQQVIATQTSVLSKELQQERQRIVEEEQARQAAAKEASEKAAQQAAKEAEQAEQSQVASNETKTANKSADVSPTTSNSSGFIRPSNGVTTSPFGYRIHPITGEHKLHGGIDFGGSGPIVAAQSGTVEIAGYDSGWGNYVKINHGNGVETLYAHMVSGSLAVAPGQKVSQGQHLGSMGMTGSATGIHLHFEVYVNGTRVDPASYLGM